MSEGATAGLIFSDDQEHARAEIFKRLAAVGVNIETGAHGPQPEGGKAPALAVLGKAGSGKTALLAHVAETLAGAGLELVGGDYEPKKNRGKRSYAVLAPTNKAASVLRARGVPATTLHRILYIPVYDPEFEKIAAWLTDSSAPKPEVEVLDDAMLERIRAFYDQHGSIPGAMAIAGLRGSDFITGWTRREDPLDVALVDEASMLDERQFEDLQELFSTLILFGDPAQLAPVGQSGSMVFDQLSEAAKPFLSRIHRQSADNPILDLAHALKDGIEFEEFEREIEKAAARDDRIIVAGRADPDLMARAPMLVWRNATRLRLIQAFRSVHGAPETSLIPGEPLICDGIELPAKHRKKRIDLEARGLIKGAQSIYLGPGKKVGFAKLHIAGSEAPTISAAAIIKIEAPDRDEPLIASAARMGAAFVHGAATTIHKAQGSQWPSVQVFAPDIFAASRTGRVEAGAPLWRRLAYVAVTRAEERLYWVTRARMARPEKNLSIADLA